MTSDLRAEKDAGRSPPKSQSHDRRAWLGKLKDPQWLGVLLGLPAALAVVIGLLSAGAKQERTIRIQKPIVQLETRGDFMIYQNEALQGLDPSVLHQPGFVIQANLTTQGYDGHWLTVECVVIDMKSLVTVKPQPHSLPATGGSQTTEPCFVPLSGSRRDRYRINIQILDSRGNHLQTSPTVVQ